jgi:hypothetical protein
MPEKYSDEKYIMAKSLLQKREGLIADVAKLSKEIARLTRLREETRTEARRLKSIAIAGELGVSKSWIEKVSERRIER